MSKAKPKSVLIIKILLWIIVIYILYHLVKFIITKFINYNDYYYLENLFTDQEIEELRKCTENNVDITTPCFSTLHNTLKQKIEAKLGKKITFHHARFSNNNNPDGQTLHRDIKPYYFFNSTFPKIYTTVFYLDKSIFYIGNKRFDIKPGDVLIFNSLCLHAAGDITFVKKNRRILQWFHTFFDEEEKKQFYKNHAFCEHHSNEFFAKYISHFIDARYLIEMANLTHIFTTTCSNRAKPFNTYINENYYIGEVNGIRYYRNF